MTPELQLNRRSGCVSACIATLLGIPVSNVPDFTNEPEVEGSTYPAFWLSMQTWLDKFGLFLLEVHLPANMPWFPLPFPALCIFFGETDRGVKHAIVGRCEGGNLIPVWNPLPDARIDGISALGFILPRDPSLTITMGKALDKIERWAGQRNKTSILFETIEREAATALQHRVNGARTASS